MPDLAIENSYRSIVGSSPAAHKLLTRIEQCRGTRCSVLITGETGTGKELLARAIHNESSGGPFIVIDCSALVAPLMESELFGYTRGAFTGALTSKMGLIEAADGGTAFFDEVGELPLEMQSKLLRVLQEKVFRPVGSLQQRKSDFRVISATNRDPQHEVACGRFRGDLYYRLAVMTLRVPPLRDRKQDIPSLVRHFLGRYGHNHVVAQEALDALQSYDWPGNIRELENCVQHMIAVNNGPLLHLYDLPSAVMNFVLATRSQAKALAMAAAYNASPPASAPGAAVATNGIVPLPEMEKRAILEALRQTKGDRTMAAALLGIGRTTLWRKIRELEEQCPSLVADS